MSISATPASESARRERLLETLKTRNMSGMKNEGNSWKNHAKRAFSNTPQRPELYRPYGAGIRAVSMNSVHTAAYTMYIEELLTARSILSPFISLVNDASRPKSSSLDILGMFGPRSHSMSAPDAISPKKNSGGTRDDVLLHPSPGASLGQPSVRALR